MTRKKKNRNKPASKLKNPGVSAKSPAAARLGSRRKLLTRALGFLVIAGVSAAGFSAYKDSWNAERDLSDIGNGIPTIVQIHDSTCPSCRELKSNADMALKSVKGEIQYRIADVGTARGRNFQIKYDVPHVTLMLFDGSGKHTKTLTGVYDVEYLARVFSGLTQSSG